MKIKKYPFIFSFALAALLVVGQTGFAEESHDNEMSHMMNANRNGMMNMMEDGNMSNMMEAMSSPEGKKMIDACGDFMEIFKEKEESK